MKIEQHISDNTIQLILTPEREAERVLLGAMHDSAKLGKKVTMSVDLDAAGTSKVARATVSVEG